MPLTKEALDDIAKRGCQLCVSGEGHGQHEELYLVPACHSQNYTLTVVYKDGVITIRCKKCQKLVAEFLVASENDHA